MLFCCKVEGGGIICSIHDPCCNCAACCPSDSFRRTCVPCVHVAIVAHGCLEVLGGGRSLRSESVLLQLVHGHGCVGHVFLELLLEVFLKQLVEAIFLVGILAVKPS